AKTEDGNGTAGEATVSHDVSPPLGLEISSSGLQSGRSFDPCLNKVRSREAATTLCGISCRLGGAQTAGVLLLVVEDYARCRHPSTRPISFKARGWWSIGRQFTIAASKVFELQHRCCTTRSSHGSGHASNLGEVEVSFRGPAVEGGIMVPLEPWRLSP